MFDPERMADCLNKAISHLTGKENLCLDLKASERRFSENAYSDVFGL